MARIGRLKIALALTALTFGLSLSVKAQVDCGYGFRIYVHDKGGETIENAKPEVSGVRKTDRVSPYVRIYFSEGAYFVVVLGNGTTLAGDYLLRVSAEGFEPYERQFKFPVCEIQSFELRLQPRGSPAKADFERLFTVHGKVFDEQMKPFGKAKIEAKSAGGRVYQTSSNAYGYYELNVPQGIATIRVTDSKFPDVVFENFKIEKNYSVLNVPVCLKCRQGESKN